VLGRDSARAAALLLTLLVGSGRDVCWRDQWPAAQVSARWHTLYVTVDEKGQELVFETETGAYQYCEPRDEAHRCRSTNEARQWRAYADPTPRP
jgi:hypothetical protein